MNRHIDMHAVDIKENNELDFRDLSLKLQNESINGKPVSIIAFEGRITNGNAFEINRKIYRIFENNTYNIIIDLSKLEYLNSSGVAMLFSIIHRAKENDGRIVIGGMHPFIHNVFCLMDLPPRLELYNTLVDAKKAF